MQTSFKSSVLSWKTIVSLALCVTGFSGMVCAEDDALTANALKILTAKCGKCHSSENRKADLDLSSIAAILKGGE